MVGDGPDLVKLNSQDRTAYCFSAKFGQELERYLLCGDVFVFPSRTDTFGVVLIEARAFGAPVAAFFVTGPVQSIDNGGTGILEGDLDLAVQSALMLNGRIVSQPLSALPERVSLASLNPIWRVVRWGKGLPSLASALAAFVGQRRCLAVISGVLLNLKPFSVGTSLPDGPDRLGTWPNLNNPSASVLMLVAPLLTLCCSTSLTGR